MPSVVCSVQLAIYLIYPNRILRTILLVAFNIVELETLYPIRGAQVENRRKLLLDLIICHALQVIL